MKRKVPFKTRTPSLPGVSAPILFRDFMDNIPDVIYFKDTSGRLIFVNKAHSRGLRLSPGDIIGKTDFDIFPKARAQRMFNDDQYVMKTGNPVVDKIERATRADGVDNYISTTKIPRYDRQGKCIGLIGVTRDITSRIRFERLKEQKVHSEKTL